MESIVEESACLSVCVKMCWGVRVSRGNSLMFFAVVHSVTIVVR